MAVPQMHPQENSEQKKETKVMLTCPETSLNFLHLCKCTVCNDLCGDMGAKGH